MWDYCYRTGISSYKNEDKLHKFSSFIEDGYVKVDEDEITDWGSKHPQPYDRNEYLGTYQDIHGDGAEPYNAEIRSSAKDGLPKSGLFYFFNNSEELLFKNFFIPLLFREIIFK